MSGFHVEVAALKADANRMNEAGSAAAKAQAYVAGKLTLGDGGYLFSNVNDRHKDVMAALTAGYEHLSKLLTASAGELVKTADNYASIDQAAAEHLDSVYPGN
ncbi:hypothetical protein D5S17_27330 [Pseudonocardiaceae bacterium YIM PH 21723]|nr:hypothetical protein D5S17_27330 [Pseudonocardiaceae bacterium YIM PH 21723]